MDYKYKKIYHVKNKKDETDEYIYIKEKFDNYLSVIIIDKINQNVYLENNYPINYLNDCKVKQLPKSEFFEQLDEQLRTQIDKFDHNILVDLTTFNEQKSLF